MKKIIISTLVFALLLCTLCLSVFASGIKNVIFLIPDGAGMNSFDMANDVKEEGGFAEGVYVNRTPVAKGPMFMNDYFAGLCSTHTIIGEVTDSAAAATALATGTKTTGTYLGVDYRGRPLATILEGAQSKGMSTGLVVTQEWMAATPAGYSSHVMGRNDYKNVYEQMENQKIDVVLGAGYGAVSEYATIQNASDRGYKIINNRDELLSVKPGEKIWGNIFESASPYDINLAKGEPTLAEMTSAAITALSGNENGFFLMVEGSCVDTGAHANHAIVTVSEYLAFDEAFKVAVEFAKTRTDTIVIATPDHDTGKPLYQQLVAEGKQGEVIEMIRNAILPDASALPWTSTGHTIDNVGVWVYLPDGVDTIEGLNPITGDCADTRENYLIDNTDFAPYIANLLDIDLDALTGELFVDVTDIGVYDAATEKFTFNSGNKYIYRNDAWYFKGEEKIDLDGKVCVYLNGRMYVPSEVVEEDDWNYVTGIQGEGTKADPYRIDDVNDFLTFTENIKNGDDYKGEYLVQTADIDLSSETSYAGLTENNDFAGVYDGRGYTITVNINSSANASVFGSLTDGAVVVNTGILGSITSTAKASGFALETGNGAVVANSYSNVALSGASSAGISFEILGKVSNCYFGGNITGGGYPIGNVTNAESIDNCYYVSSCGASQENSGITAVTEQEAKNTLASLLENTRNAAAIASGFDVDDILKWRQSGIFYLPEVYVPSPTVTAVIVTPENPTVSRGGSLRFYAQAVGEYNPSNEVLWTLESSYPLSDNTYITEDGVLYVGILETAPQFTVMAKSKVNGAVTGWSRVSLGTEIVIDENTSIDSLNVSGDTEVTANGFAVTIDALEVSKNAILTLGRGTYIIKNFSGEGRVVSSENANVIIECENKPDGYVEINIGEKKDERNVRYAEVGGYQYEICEHNNLYGVVAVNDMLIEITEKTFDGAVVAESTRYFFVDSENESYSELSLSDFFKNKNDLSIRTGDKMGMRFKAAINPSVKDENDSFEISEYGFIIGLESALINNCEQLNFDAAKYVYGVAFSKENSVNIIFDSSDDTSHIIAGVLHSIPDTAYGETVVTKTYTKINVDGSEYTVYGEPISACMYEVAMYLRGVDLTQEQQNTVETIIEKATDMSPDLGFDAGIMFE